MEINKTYFGDCLDVMKLIDDASIDLILCDLPYGVTKNKWDSVIDLKMLWAEYERVIKTNGAIVLFGQDKFSAKLMLSNEKLHRYNLIWEKTTPTGHLNAKKMPLRSHEDILVFYKKLPTYNPQKTTGHKRKVSTAQHKRGSKKTTNYGEHGLTT
jgi:DNA modification methylase